MGVGGGASPWALRPVRSVEVTAESEVAVRSVGVWDGSVVAALLEVGFMAVGPVVEAFMAEDSAAGDMVGEAAVRISA